MGTGQRSFGDSPVHRMLGLELLERTEEAAEIRMPVRPEFIQEEGVVQGGILTALADAAAVYLLLPDLPEDASMTSVELKISFLRPAVRAGGPLLARAEALRRGRTISVCRASVKQDGRLVADALATYVRTG